MKKSLFTFFVFSIALLTASPLFSQKAPIKFGKIDKDNLLMTHYPLDSSAHAVVLCDFGEAVLEYETSQEIFHIRFDRLIRIKIIDEAGFDYANFSIPLYADRNEEEELQKFKAATYNIVDGQIVTTKVARKELLTDKISDRYKETKVVMPEIKAGSIIEIQYAVRSPFTWNLYDWQFQDKIPTKHSEYRVAYPDWFDYKKNFKGYDLEYLTVKDENKVSDKIVFNYIKRSGGKGATPASSKGESQTVDYLKNVYRYVAQDMPAFEDERYISSRKNYLTAIEFELASTQFPNSIITNYTNTWEDINKNFWKSEKLGKQLSSFKLKSFEDEVNQIKAGQEKSADQITAIYYHLKKNVLWNEQNGSFASADIKKVYKDGKGNAAGINLLLTAMLRAGGFEAHPVVLSTRNHGFLNEWFPSMGQFNYLITAVKMADEKMWLLDATDRSLPINLLPPRCINGKGLVIDETGYSWVSLQPNGKFRHVQQVKATLNDDLTWVGKMDVKCKDYAARGIRQEFAKEGTEEEYLQMLQNENEGLNIANSSFEDMTTLAREAKASYEVTIEDNVIDGGEMLYFNPMLTFNFEENPFKLQERKYPVDFNYPLEYIYAASFEIPDNYTIEELPETLSIALPDKGGKYSYTLSATGNTINLTSQLKINKYLFLPQEYGGLKEFYNLIVDKMAGQIVLKKKS